MSNTPSQVINVGSQVINVASQVINVVSLPINNNTFTGINVATISISNSFLDISLKAICGNNSNITIIKPGATPITYNGVVNTNLKLGSDIYNKIPFIGKQTIIIIFNAVANESITINQLNFKGSVAIDYKKFLIIFLIVYFVLNIIV